MSLVAYIMSFRDILSLKGTRHVFIKNIMYMKGGIEPLQRT